MKTVAQILKGKAAHDIVTVSPKTTVFEAIQLMSEKNIGALLVTDGDKIVGIFTERDYARKIALKGHSSRTTPVGDIMSAHVMYVKPSQTNEECMAIMTDNRVRHLPVLDQGKLLGILSIGDLVKDMISEQKFIIDQLEHYISGSQY
jgi:CBS domain-containing protein